MNPTGQSITEIAAVINLSTYSQYLQGMNKNVTGVKYKITQFNKNNLR